MLTANVSPTPAQTSGRTIRILILYSHERRAPGVIGFTRELNGVLRREWRGEVEVYDETMDVDRLGGQKNWTQFASYLGGKYGALQPRRHRR